MNVSLIGSGNVAWHLAPALDNTEYSVREVYSRNERNSESLAEKLYDAAVKSTLDFSSSPSRIFIIAVADDAISEVVKELILPDDATLVHTSGSQSLAILDDAAAAHTGVFYPLQTFTRGRKVDFSEIPLFIESNDPHTEALLLKMARAISKKVYRISSEQRQALHVAAVFASNFANHLLAISRQILSDNNMDFDLLKPLIAETINKALTIGPDAAQTGPARRGDLEILDKHLEFLKKDEGIAEVYRVMSQHILDRYSD